ncbi:uncharacterized protein [Asterias amurensis]
MAEGGDPSALLDKFGEDYLNCTICHERYNRPKILNCLHSFCEGCLVKYKPSQGQVKLSCPVCRQETVIHDGGVVGLKTNFPLMGMVEAFLKSLTPTSRSSSFISSTSMESVSSPAPSIVQECRKHPGEKTWFYCRPCQELVCHVCTAKTHKHHEFQEIDEAAANCKDSLQSYFPQIKNILEDVEGELEVSGRVNQLLALTAEASKQEVEERTNAAIAKVMASRQDILDLISAVETKTTKEVKERLKRLTTLRDRMQHSLKLSEHLTKSASAQDIISLFPIVQTDLKRLSDNQHTQTEIKTTQPVSFMKLLSTTPVEVPLGKLVVKTELWEMDRRVGKTGGDKEDFDGARGITLLADGCVAVADLGMWTKGITLFTPDWVYKHSIKFPNKPRDVAAVNDSMVVADNTDAVKVYNANRLAFQFKTTPPEEGAKVSVNLVSVAAKKNNILVVGDVKRQVITQHCVTDGKLLGTVHTSIPPYFVDVNNDDGHVLISGLDTGKIEEIDGKGETVFTLSPGLAGADVSCRGVCYNPNGGFYAVVQAKDSNQGHIHQYESSGEFLGCVAKGLYDPNGIAMTSEGELAVADCFSVKVFKRI